MRTGSHRGSLLAIHTALPYLGLGNKEILFTISLEGVHRYYICRAHLMACLHVSYNTRLHWRLEKTFLVSSKFTHRTVNLKPLTQRILKVY